MFTDPRNNTFAIPEQQKKIYAEKMAENPRPPMQEPKPIIDFKYYPPPPPFKPKEQFPKPNIANYLPAYGNAPFLPGPMEMHIINNSHNK